MNWHFGGYWGGRVLSFLFIFIFIHVFLDVFITFEIRRCIGGLGWVGLGAGSGGAGIYTYTLYDFFWPARLYSMHK